MTAHYGAGVLPERMSDAVLSNPESSDCLIPMGITSENVAKQYGVSRDVQDSFAANSFAKAAEAQRLGKFKEEIVPVKVSFILIDLPVICGFVADPL
jgi:acetyl-CoA acyltransferase 1